MTTTVNYSWALPTVGASVNTWGTLVNNILIDIDAKMFARTGGTISGNVSVTGTGAFSSTLYMPQNNLLQWNSTGASGGTNRAVIWGDSSGNLNFGNGSGNATSVTIDASGNLMVAGPRLSIGDAGAINVAAGGTIALNIESISGLGTAGLLIVRGNENDLNQSIALYTYNLSFTGTSRYCRITQVQRNTLNNTYGDVYAYLSNYAGSYTTTDQTFSSSSTSMSDIYFRNVAAAPCNANFSIIRLV